MFAFQRETELARLEVLHRLTFGEPAVVVIPAVALMQKVIPLDVLKGYGEWISIGDTRERDELMRKLMEGGYVRVTLVEGRGEFSVAEFMLFPAREVILTPERRERAVRNIRRRSNELGASPGNEDEAGRNDGNGSRRFGQSSFYPLFYAAGGMMTTKPGGWAPFLII